MSAASASETMSLTGVPSSADPTTRRSGASSLSRSPPGKTLWTSSDTDVVVIRADGIVLSNLSAGKVTLYDPASGRAIGPSPRLALEDDQVTVPLQIDADHHVYPGRGCPGRG